MQTYTLNETLQQLAYFDKSHIIPADVWTQLKKVKNVKGGLTGEPQFPVPLDTAREWVAVLVWRLQPNMAILRLLTDFIFDGDYNVTPLIMKIFLFLPFGWLIRHQRAKEIDNLLAQFAASPVDPAIYFFQ